MRIADFVIHLQDGDAITSSRLRAYSSSPRAASSITNGETKHSTSTAIKPRRVAPSGAIITQSSAKHTSNGFRVFELNVEARKADCYIPEAL